MSISRIRSICIEIYKTINNENPSYMNEIFKKLSHITSLRYPNNLEVPKINQALFGTRSIRKIGPEIWNKLPENIKNSTSLHQFKRYIKLWDGPNCT